MHNRLRAQPSEPVVQRLRRVGVRDGDALLQQDRPGIEALLHLHDRDPGRRVPREQRALDWRSAAPAWQQRRVYVQATSRRNFQHRVRQDKTVGGDHHGLRAHCLER